MVEEHLCGESTKNKMVSVKFLAKKYINKVQRTPTISSKSFIRDVFDELHIELTNRMAWRAIKAAGYMLYGNEIQQFTRLWSYANELLHVMPNSTVIIKQHGQKFERIYVCPAPLKTSVLSGCVDGDNGIYPVAWSVVEVENMDS
ncbi:hypothetical protein LIER_36522 [Lithospermum erythrorhizon]|uniref:Uncharacterized protein n=1 Tax=Lithospermum erythrorhizon TaxID=34254 RepID=A0AAV3P8J6_LITER